MLTAPEVVGVPEDWADFITLCDEHDTPILRSITKSGQPADELNNYQAKAYRAPRRSNQPDGKDWETFEAVKHRVQLQARMDRWDETAAVSWKSEKVKKANGLQDELDEAILDQLELMGRQIECTLASDQPAYVDDGANQDNTQAIGLWIQSGTTSQLYPTPESVRPSAAQIYSGNKADFIENSLRDLMAASWDKTGKTNGIDLFLGSSLKNAIDFFPFLIPSSASTQSTSRVSNRDNGSTALGQVVNTYSCTYGMVSTHLTKWNAAAGFTGGSAAESVWRGYGLHRDMWDFRWHTKPDTTPLEFKGGSYNVGILSAGQLRCLNPIGEIKIAVADA
jgi:hypothetical protein